MTVLIWGAFVAGDDPAGLARSGPCRPTASSRFDADFLTHSMRGVFGGMDAGRHLPRASSARSIITLAATVISVPIGLLTAIYLVEYGRGALARAVTFFVDVMTGIPSIVAGLFAFALFTCSSARAQDAASSARSRCRC